MGLTNCSYDPAANTWRPIARLLLPEETAVLACTGHQVFDWGGVCCSFRRSGGRAKNPGISQSAG